MKRNFKIILYLTSLTVLIMFVAHIFNNPYFIYANTDKISISTNPQGVLFDATNIKPGDKFERKLTVKNEGELDFYYQSESKKVSGSDKLFNQLLLEVFDSEGNNLYEGSLAGFKGFEARFLPSFEDEELTFIAEFPEESGNEFQGLETQFAIIFFAESFGENDDEDEQKDEDGQDKDEQDKSDEQSKDGPDSDDSSKDEQVKGDSTLPKTGEELPLIYYLVGLSLIILGITIYFFKRKQT